MNYPKVLNKHKDKIPDDAIYIGRPSKWGNPFIVGKDGNREEVVQKYEQWLKLNPEVVKEAKTELVGKSLICYCAPQACHGDVLVKIANEFTDKPLIRFPWDVTQDGIDHINVYSKGKTELGRLLTNFSNVGFYHPGFGKFASVEGFWYWAATGMKHDQLRNLVGFKAKEEGRKHPKVQNDSFHQHIEEAIRFKIEQDPDLFNKFIESTLPFAHYYVYGNYPNFKAIEDASSVWLCYYLEKLRTQLRDPQKERDLRVIIAGSRDITDYDQICDALAKTPFDVGSVVCGMAKGPDLLGKDWANARHIKVHEFPADWDSYGKSAGYIRNAEMGKYADALIALWDGQSSGTKHMFEYMQKLKKPVFIYNTTTKNSA